MGTSGVAGEIETEVRGGYEISLRVVFDRGEIFRGGESAVTGSGLNGGAEAGEAAFACPSLPA